MAKIISFFNHKGGVGKTSSVYNIACALRSLGQKVLVVDADPQMNLTAKIYGFSTSMEYTEDLGSRWRENSDTYISLYDVIMNIFTNTPHSKPIYAQASNHTGHIHIIPSSFSLAELETDIVDIVKRNNVLDRGKMYAVEKYFRNELGEEYDFILIDFSPSASSVINGLLMLLSDYFIIPASPTLFCLQAIENMENVFRNWLKVLSDHKRTMTTSGLTAEPKFLGVLMSIVKRTSPSGSTGPTQSTQKWHELLNERTLQFYSYANESGKSISRDEFIKIFPNSTPFIIDYAYDYTLELRTKADSLGKSEFDLQGKEIPQSTSTRNDENGNKVKVKQYVEAHSLIVETYTYIAHSLMKLSSLK